MSSKASLDYWCQRWTKGETQWILDSGHPKLHAHIHRLTQGRDPKDAGLIFIPLCGNCADLKILYQEGFVVLGVECFEPVVREFFEENRLEFEESVDERIGKVFATLDGKLKILCGDVLKVTRDVVGDTVQMVWDRGSLVAMNKNARKPYAEVLKSLLGPGARYLLSSVDYRDWFFEGPPRHTPLELLKDLFQDRFQNFELLDSESMPDEYHKLVQMPITENIYLMTD